TRIANHDASAWNRVALPIARPGWERNELREAVVAGLVRMEARVVRVVSDRAAAVRVLPDPGAHVSVEFLGAAGVGDQVGLRFGLADVVPLVPAARPNRHRAHHCDRAAKTHDPLRGFPCVPAARTDAGRSARNK